MSENYTLYMHTSPSGKRYIGITCRQPERRWCNGRGYGHCPYFKCAIQKYGWENIKHEILLTGLTKERAEEAERFYIALFRSNNRKFGYNCASGGQLGNTHSFESRLKMSESQRGEKNGMYGKHLSAEARAKIGEANRGKVVSAETRARMSEAFKGRQISSWHRERVGEAHSEPVVNLDTGEVYKSATAAAKACGMDKSAVQRCCSGKVQTSAGYHWKYAKDLDGEVVPSEDHKRMTPFDIRREYAPSVINLDTNEVFRSLADAAETYGVSRTVICECCKGKQKTAAGHYWAYTDDGDAIERYKQAKASGTLPVLGLRKVINLDTGEVFESAAAAAAHYGVTRHCIGRHLRGLNKTACGYHWAYVEKIQ